ncbi:hypothetical protein [Nitrospira sp. Nam74]
MMNFETRSVKKDTNAVDRRISNGARLSTTVERIRQRFGVSVVT